MFDEHINTRPRLAMNEPLKKSGWSSAFKKTIAVIGLLVVILVVFSIPKFLASRQLAIRNACLNHLIQIDGAKQQWKIEHKKPDAATPTWEELKPYLVRQVKLNCPAGGSYTLGRVDELPSCSIGSTVTPAHILP